MRINNLPRGSGKTLRMIYTADTTGVPIVVKYQSRKSYIEQMAKDLNCSVVVLLPEDLKYDRHDSEILIDEAQDYLEEALEQYFRKKIVAVTMTLPMKEISNE